MGREIRRVPSGWEHPLQNCPHIPHEEECFLPLFDESLQEAQRDWDRRKIEFEDDSHRKDYTFEEWEGKRPEGSDYRPDWPEASRTHYQWYETVSEGTPLSPPFATETELVDFIVEAGDPVFGAVTKEQAELFVERGYAPSMYAIGGRVVGGIQGVPT